MTASTTTSSFEGVLKILRFNTRFYAGSTLVLMVAFLLLASNWLPSWLKILIWCGAIATAFWTLSSILVSWYVYDYAGVTRWEWMRTRLPLVPLR